MKLPQVTYGKPESFGRGETSAVQSLIAATGQQGRTEQAAMEMVAKVSNQYIERKQNAEYNEQMANTSIQMSEWEEKNNGKLTYTSEDIKGLPPEIPRMETFVNDDGDQETTRRMEIPAHEVYPLLLKRQLDAVIANNAAKISNPNLRADYMNKSQTVAAGKMMRATVAAEESQRAYMNFDNLDKANSAADQGNELEAIFFIEQMEIDPVTERQYLETVATKVEIHDINKAIRSTNPETVMVMRAMLDDPNYDGNLTEPQRQQAINGLGSRLKVLDFDRLQEMTKQHEVAYSNAYKDIEEGNMSLLDVENGFALYEEDSTNPMGWSGAERTSLRNKINARDAKLNALNADMALAAGVIEFGGDMWNPDHQNAIDTYVEQNAITDPRKLEQITISSNIMPQAMQSYMNAQVFGEPSSNSQNALDMYGRLKDNDPHVLRKLGDGARDMYSEAHTLSLSGISGIEALTIAQENSKTPESTREQRKQDYKLLKPLEENPGKLKSMMASDDTRFGLGVSWYKANLDPPDRVVGEFNALTASYYQRTGDMARSQAMAYTAIQETWSPTKVGATYDGLEVKHDQNRPGKYSPERMMNVTTEVANDRLGAFATFHGLDPKQLMVLDDPQTARDGSWAIMVIDPETDLPDFYVNKASGQYVRWEGQKWAEAGQKHAYAKAVAEALKIKEKEEAGHYYSGRARGVRGLADETE